MQPLSVAPGTAAVSDSIAEPPSLSAIATLPDSIRSPALVVVAVKAAQVPAPAERPTRATNAMVASRRERGLIRSVPDRSLAAGAGARCRSAGRARAGG